MGFLLDTNICSAHIKRPTGLAHYFLQHSGRLFVPTIVLAELFVGAQRASSARLLAAIDALASDLHILDFDNNCARVFGHMTAEMMRLGKPMSFADGLIAATALAHGLTLVTHNTVDFVHVPGLVCVDWLLP